MGSQKLCSAKNKKTDILFMFRDSQSFFKKEICVRIKIFYNAFPSLLPHYILLIFLKKDKNDDWSLTTLLLPLPRLETPHCLPSLFQEPILLSPFTHRPLILVAQMPLANMATPEFKCPASLWPTTTQATHINSTEGGSCALRQCGSTQGHLPFIKMAARGSHGRCPWPIWPLRSH